MTETLGDCFRYAGYVGYVVALIVVGFFTGAIAAFYWAG